MKRGPALSLSKGFTIIELMLYMAMFSILVTILGGIFLNIMELQLTTQANSEVTQSVNYLFSRFTYDFYAASTVTTPASAGQTTQSITLIINGVANTYSISGNDLVLTNPSGSYVLNSPDVSISSLNVTRYGTAGKPNLYINLTVQSNVHSLSKAPQTASYSQSFTLR